MADRTLTTEDREKIRRLLETIDPGNIRLAISLLEKTGSDEDVDSSLSDDVILPLVASSDPEIFARTALLALGVEASWQRCRYIVVT